MPKEAKVKISDQDFMVKYEAASKAGKSRGELMDDIGMNPGTFATRTVKVYMEAGKAIPKLKEGRRAQESRDWAKVKTNTTAVLNSAALEHLQVKAGQKIYFQSKVLDGDKVIVVTRSEPKQAQQVA